MPLFKELDGVLGDLVDEFVSFYCCEILGVHPGWAFAFAAGTTILALSTK